MVQGRKPQTPRFSAAEVKAWRKLMGEMGWSQKQLADHTGISYAEIKKFLIKDAYGELQ